MPYSIHRSGKQCAGRSGFTLLELLIVVGIITILIVLGLSVAGKVTSGGKVRATEQTLRVLDTALSTFIQNTGSNPPAFITDPRPANNGGKYVQPVIDGRCETTGQIVNSVGYFMFQCKAIPAAAAGLKGLDSKYLREYTPDLATTAWDAQGSLPTAFDGWGHPIRYVHPLFKGVIPPSPAAPATFVPTASIQPAPPGKTYGITGIRRNNDDPTNGGSSPEILDADGGLNPATRPYFYSAGPDGKVGYGKAPDGTPIDYNADNIYLTTPRFQKN